MFLIVGLGNPGLDYAYTRHNVGFMLADYLSYELGFSDYRSKFEALYTEKVFELSAKVIIQKPQTFMNASGRAVSQITQYYNIASHDVFVIQDDLDMDPLKVKIKFGGSNGGHNGLRDIEKAIGKEYWHIKIGIGRPKDKAQVAEYVLSSFYKDEIVSLQQKIFPIISRNLLDLVFSDNRVVVANKIMHEVACS